MKPFYTLSAAEQVAQYLRTELQRGSFIDTLPGVKILTEELGVNHKTIKMALKILESEGILLNQGQGKKRQIVVSKLSPLSAMKVGLLYYDSHTASQAYALELKQAILDKGYVPVIATKTMQKDLKMNTKRIIDHVESFDVDAWLVYAGSSEILEWFSNYDVPAFAVYGRLNKANIAGTAIRKSNVIKDVIKNLVGLGHRRIVMIVRSERRKPNYGLPERLFLEELESHGIQTSSYNIPDWEDDPDGLECLIDSLYQHTPPTAILVSDPVLFHAVQNHLSLRGVNAPENVSLFCNDYVESFDWVKPTIAHLTWSHKAVTRRVIQWLDNISHHQEDKKLSYIKARLVEGDSIGPPASNNNL